MMNRDDIFKTIENGEATLGIELGSTRIKAVLIDGNHHPIASGSHEWENRFENGIWTYSIDDIWTGLQASYRALTVDVAEKYGLGLARIAAIGISAMMHGYMAFDRDEKLLAPFRTWRNTMTGQAAERLTDLFNFNIPQRWSIAHLYQSILNNETHVTQIHYLTTLAGYVHWQLTGQKVLGIGDASGMFPIDSQTNTYDIQMMGMFNDLEGVKGLPWRLQDILPRVLIAGERAGVLSEQGAKLLDNSDQLKYGIPFCPPEGDAGTGMTATNSVAKRTCNVSAGTSIFAMAVLEKPLSRVHPEIDMVTTPAGKPVAMVHCNNCTSDLNAWMNLFQEFAGLMGAGIDPSDLYEILFKKALEGDADGGGLLAYNYLSGEHITHFTEGRPLFVRTPASRFTLANFMRVNLFSTLATLKIGLDILFNQEQVKIDRVLGHGGFFKTPIVGQQIMAAAMDAPVSVMETAGEGGAWGIALLASFMLHRSQSESLEEYLNAKVFSNQKGSTLSPDRSDVQGFAKFMARYKDSLEVEEAAVRTFK
mgnify:FL=1